MNNLFNKLPEAKDLLQKRNENRDKEIEKQLEIILNDIENLTKEDKIIVSFPVLNEIRSVLYRKGYNIIVNGDESIITIRDPKEDIDDEWTTYDCGGN